MGDNQTGSVGSFTAGETDFEADDEDDECSRTYIQQLYVESGNNKSVLFLFCCGLKDKDGAPLFDLHDKRFANTPKSDLKPKVKQYQEEVLRRAKGGLLNEKEREPRPSHWSANDCLLWFDKHPNTAPDDVSFLEKEVKKLKEVADAALVERTTTPGKNLAWRGLFPHLRLIMVLLEDDVKHKYLRRDDAITRQQLDARNSTSREQTVYELIANQWNDGAFNPTTPVSLCHEDYATEIDCSFNQVKDFMEATPQKVKDILSQYRMHLLCIIRKWEESGQGDGGTLFEEEEKDEQQVDEEKVDNTPLTEFEFGSLQDRPAKALDTRSSFLGNRPSYLLLFWELADKHQLLSSTIQKINSEASASDADSAPSVMSSGGSSNKNPRMKQQSDEDRNAITALASSFENFTKTEKRNRAEEIASGERLHIR